MKLYCVDCGALIPAANIDLTTGLAKCEACSSVFRFTDRLPTNVGVGSSAQITAKILPQPPQMKVEHWGGTLRISWRWFKWTYVAMAGFCIFWDGFLIFWYTLAFTQHGPLVMKLFPIMHLAIGVSLTYLTLAGFLNRTVIEVTKLDLNIRHSPLPWWDNRRLQVKDIGQLFCERTNVRYSNNNYGPTYQLCATLGEGKKLRLIGGLDYVGEARFLEQQIETYLDIEHQPVVGECEG